MYLLPLVAAVAGAVLTHVTGRSLPLALRPFTLLSAVFFWSAVCAGLVAIILERASASSTGKAMFSAHTGALVVAMLLFQGGFVLAYKVGAPIGTSALIVNTLASVILLAVGALVFKETFTTRVLIGCVLVVVGVILASWPRLDSAA